MTQDILDLILSKSIPPTGVIPNYIPELERGGVNPLASGLLLEIQGGDRFSGGTISDQVSIQSIGKLLLFAYALERGGDPEKIADTEAVGMPFYQDPITSGSTSTAGHALNNAGGISSASEVKDRNNFLEFVRICCDSGSIDIIEDIYLSEKAHWENNLKLSASLASVGRFDISKIESSLDIYTKTCSLGVTLENLLHFGSVCMNGGVANSGKRILSQSTVVRLLNAMGSFGLYDETTRMNLMVAGSGQFPAKSAVSGCILCVIPGKATRVSYGRHLDHAGNSVFGVLSSMHLHAHIFPDQLRLETQEQEKLVETYLEEVKTYTRKCVTHRLVGKNYCASSFVLSEQDIIDMKSEIKNTFDLLQTEIHTCFL